MSQPYVRLNIRVDRPLNAESIANSIAEDYREARLPAETRLPPIRFLAHQLGVSKNTVQAAYDELAARDITESRGRKGVFVKSAWEVPVTACAEPIAPAKELPEEHKGSETRVNLSSVFKFCKFKLSRH